MDALLLAYVLVLLALGALCLGFPTRVQAWAVRSVRPGSFPGSSRVAAFVESRAYLWNVRAVGLVAMLMAVLLAWGKIKAE